MKRAVQAIVILAAVLVLLELGLSFFVNANRFRPRLQTALSSGLGRQVTLGDLSFSQFSGSVTARDLSIGDDPRFGAGPFLTAKSIVLGVQIWPLITARRVSVGNLTITEPAISLIEDSSGEWNVSTMGSKADPPPSAPSDANVTGLDLSVKRIDITDGRLSLTRRDGGRKPVLLSGVNATLTDLRRGARFSFSLTAKLAPNGNIQIQGAAGPLGSANSLNSAQISLKMSGIDLAESQIAEGSGVAGMLSIDGSGKMAGTAVDWKGTLRIERAVFARRGTPAKEPVESDVAGHHDLHDHAGTISQGNIRLGNAAATLTGGYSEQGGVTALNLLLAGSAMPMGALTGMLPPLDIRLPAGTSLEGGTVSMNAKITGPTDRTTLAGTLAVNNTTLKGFDLASKVGAIEKLAGLPASPETSIETLSATLRSDPNGIAIRNLRFVAPSVGEIDGTGTISPKNDLDFRMVAALTSRGALMAAFGGKKTELPFFVQGTTTNPVFKRDVAGIAASEVKRLTGARIGGVSADTAIKDLGGLLGGRKKAK